MAEICFNFLPFFEFSRSLKISFKIALRNWSIFGWLNFVYVSWPKKNLAYFKKKIQVVFSFFKANNSVFNFEYCYKKGCLLLLLGLYLLKSNKTHKN